MNRTEANLINFMNQISKALTEFQKEFDEEYIDYSAVNPCDSCMLEEEETCDSIECDHRIIDNPNGLTNACKRIQAGFITKYSRL